MAFRSVIPFVHDIFGGADLSSQRRVDRGAVEHEFIDRLFAFWDASYRGSLSLQVGWIGNTGFQSGILTHPQDIVSGLDGVMFNDLMDNIEWFFNIHDKNKDGFLSKDEVLTLSESMLVGGSSPPERGLCMNVVADEKLSSLSLGMRSGMHTLVQSADSCQTHSSTEMRCYPRRLLGNPPIRTVRHHRSSRTNRT